MRFKNTRTAGRRASQKVLVIRRVEKMGAMVRHVCKSGLAASPMEVWTVPRSVSMTEGSSQHRDCGTAPEQIGPARETDARDRENTRGDELFPAHAAKQRTAAGNTDGRTIAKHQHSLPLTHEARTDWPQRLFYVRIVARVGRETRKCVGRDAIFGNKSVYSSSPRTRR